jgi:menaquinone-9 beta-reductase
MTDFDVIIVGGGPAGSSAAIQLAASGARVLVAEQKKFPREKLCGEFISPECLGHFARLGALERMEAAHGAHVTQTVFYAPSGRSLTVPSAWFAGGEQAALGLSRAEMDARLLERAREAGVCVLEDATLAGVIVEEDEREDKHEGKRVKDTLAAVAHTRVAGVRLHVAGGSESEHRAPLTIDATGRGRAVVRRAERECESARGKRDIGAEESKARASLVAFKAHLEGARGEARDCEIYFYPGGYGGLSRVEGGLSNLCFIVRARDVRERESDAERVMREVLMRNRRAARTLADARASSRWLGVAIESFGRHDPAPAAGLLAVGDAASFIDPFTGSGMLMALESGELAAQAVSKHLAELNSNTETDRANALDALALDYRAAYGARFNARLRFCGLLRRAAFAPTQVAEAAVVILGASAAVRRRLARATRQSAMPSR